MRALTKHTITRRTLFSFAAGALLVGALTACVGPQAESQSDFQADPQENSQTGSRESLFEGDYVGNNGSSLALKKDGVAIFSNRYFVEKSKDDHVGTWSIKGDRLIVDTVVLDYEIFADISKDPTDLFFEGDPNDWLGEYFEKTQAG